MNIGDESIKLFFDFIQEEKVGLPIDRYRDFCTLSEFFCIPNFTRELYRIMEEELCKDLDFSIQILLDNESANTLIETEISSKIENFLRDRVSECIENKKFGDLPISTIYRIVERSEKEKIDQSLLIDFILDSLVTRFMLLKFVDFHQLRDDKIDKFFEFIDKEEKKEMLFEYTPFNYSFIKQMKNNCDKLLKDLKQTKEELNQKNEKLSQIEEELNQKNEKFNQTNEELSRVNKELSQSKEELNQTKEKLVQNNEKLNQTEDELEQIKRVFTRDEYDTNRIKSEMSRCAQAIYVGGCDGYNQLGKYPNNKSKMGKLIIHPPLKFPFSPDSLLSYSVYTFHSVLVTRGGSLLGAGDNRSGRISSSLQRTEIKQFTEFSIKDSSGHHLTPVSAVCSRYGTLYMLIKSSGIGRQLVICDCDIDCGSPVFLDIGNEEPVSLFGGYSHFASISDKGEIIFINRNTVKKSPETRITAVSLPDGSKAKSIACCDNSVYVLNSNGQVFELPINIKRGEEVRFSDVEELKDKEIICLSGTNEHCIAVCKDGCVFGKGSNGDGRLGISKETESVSSFTLISSLEGYKIKTAYAGTWHSIFETREGKILSCGFNNSGELLLDNGTSYPVYSPQETMITGDVRFIIAGNSISTVFIGDPPPNTPNMPIQRQ